MKISLVQYDPKWEDPEGNQAEIRKLLDSYGPETDLLVFPELTLTGFTMKPEKYSAAPGEGYTSFFASIAKERGAYVVFGEIIREGERYLNTLRILDRNGTRRSNYYKIHPFSYGDENKHYSGGTELVMSDIDGIKTGFSICYDLRFPELYRFYGKEKGEILINIANWPITRIEHWRTLLKARAIENQAFVVGVNRTGKDPQLQYNGCSSIFNPMGEELCCIVDDVEIRTIEIDLGMVQEVRKKFPFLEDIKLI